MICFTMRSCFAFWPPIAKQMTIAMPRHPLSHVPDGSRKQPEHAPVRSIGSI